MASQKVVQSNLDATKVLAFDVDTIATATTRTVTMPDKSGELFKAADVDITSITNMAATDVQGALAELQSDVDGLAAGTSYKGDWDASAGTFPGGGSASAGDKYTVSVAGTVDSISFTVGDTVYARINSASTTTYAGNWVHIEEGGEHVPATGQWAVNGQTPSSTQGGYSTSNLATNRTIDANDMTLEQLGDVLGTLIEDLKTKGILSA